MVGKTAVNFSIIDKYDNFDEISFIKVIFFMAKTSKTRCPNCGFLETIKWGIRSGHQRYKCQNSNTLFTPCRKDVSMRNRFIWFKWWIIHKQTISEISKLSGYSTRQLHRWFEEYLENYPRWEIQRRESVNLLIDGTWFPNQMCLVHLKTDSGFLYQYTIELIKKNGMTCNVDNNDLYLQGGADDKILSIRTFYEQQWLNRGKTIKYVQFMLDGSESIEEPDVDIEKDDYHSQSQYMSVVEE